MIDQIDRMPDGRVYGGRPVVHGALAFWNSGGVPREQRAVCVAVFAMNGLPTALSVGARERGHGRGETANERDQAAQQRDELPAGRDPKADLAAPLSAGTQDGRTHPRARRSRPRRATR